MSQIYSSIVKWGVVLEMEEVQCTSTMHCGNSLMGNRYKIRNQFLNCYTVCIIKSESACNAEDYVGLIYIRVTMNYSTIKLQSISLRGESPIMCSFRRHLLRVPVI